MHTTFATNAAVTQRTIDRVESHLHLGGDTQVDDRNVAIMPLQSERTDPFLLLSEEWISSPGFEWHPHRGLETVTFVLDGVLEHVGNVGTLEAGDVQWMTAGRGIIHREHAFRNEHVHILQLWVNLPADRKFVEPGYQDLFAARRPVVELDGVRVDVISGATAGITGRATNQWPITAAMVTLEPNSRLDHLIPAHDRAFAYVLRGEANVAGHRVSAGQIAWSDPVAGPLDVGAISALSIATGEGDAHTVVMVYSGKPIGQPVAMGGPFVMNTHAEIEQAFRDYHTGKFGPMPHAARLQMRSEQPSAQSVAPSPTRPVTTPLINPTAPTDTSNTKEHP